VKKTEDFTNIEDGESQAQFTIPDTAKDGDVYTAYLYEGNRIKDASSVVVKETDARKYEPAEPEEIKKDYGQPTTEDDIKNAITVPDYDNSNGDYTISVDDPSQLPDGSEEGTTNVDVTVEYPDHTTDHISVPVTVGAQPDADKYDPSSEGLTKDNGEAPTADEITNTVTIPGLSDEDKERTEITVDNDSDIPDGTTPGTTNVPVTVTYPDGTTDHVDVPVTINEPTEAPVKTP
ncbi:Rib/alpha-like domain-containing protein, partial [Cutibacterium acnes]